MNCYLLQHSDLLCTHISFDNTVTFLLYNTFTLQYLYRNFYFLHYFYSLNCFVIAMDLDSDEEVIIGAAAAAVVLAALPDEVAVNYSYSSQ